MFSLIAGISVGVFLGEIAHDLIIDNDASQKCKEKIENGVDKVKEIFKTKKR